jgi:hypothetical protein
MFASLLLHSKIIKMTELFLFLFVVFFYYLYYYRSRISARDIYDKTNDHVTFEEAPSIPSWLQTQYPFHRKVVTINGLKIHYIDEGDPNAPYTVLMVKFTIFLTTDK